MPFTISIYSVGTMHRYEHNSYAYHDTTIDLGSVDSSLGFTFTIDTAAYPHYDSLVQYSLTNDKLTLTLISLGAGWYPGTRTLSISFAPGKDSIISLIYQETDSEYNSQDQKSYDNYTFTISSLLFDDTSIFSDDSSLLGHKLTMEDLHTDLISNGIDLFDYTYSDFTSSSSVTLSGIFRPTTFFNPPAIVTEAPQPNNLAIYSSNGSIACSFEVSDHARDLEIFSPLGIREASFTIPAGRTEASLPHLSAGFYFVRLDGSMAKVYILD